MVNSGNMKGPNGLRKPKIAISMGDPNGIGPEILLKVLADPSVSANCDIVVVGSSRVLDFYCETPSGHGRIETAEVDASGFDIRPGFIDGNAGRIAMVSVQRAVELCQSGEVDAMVTCPISKEAISLAGYDFPGHTEFIADLLRSPDHLMLMVSDHLKIGMVTGHIPLSRVPQAITEENILRTAHVMIRSLQHDFNIEHPHIAVLGLNPHAGDGGVLGPEENQTILPAIKKAASKGLHVAGPFPADGFFGNSTWKSFDGIIAMYHDQGLIPFKALSFGAGVNFTAGLDIVRTSPDHGTAFNIAGSGVANASSLKKAILCAIEVAQNRKKVQ